jgi:hypothetical protein
VRWANSLGNDENQISSARLEQLFRVHKIIFASEENICLFEEINEKKKFEEEGDGVE